MSQRMNVKITLIQSSAIDAVQPSTEIAGRQFVKSIYGSFLRNWNYSIVNTGMNRTACEQWIIEDLYGTVRTKY